MTAAAPETHSLRRGLVADRACVAAFTSQAVGPPASLRALAPEPTRQTRAGVEHDRNRGERSHRQERPSRTPARALVQLRRDEEPNPDAERVTNAFRYLAPVHPNAHRGERPITIEWALSTPLLPEWVRRWRNVT